MQQGILLLSSKCTEIWIESTFDFIFCKDFSSDLVTAGPKQERTVEYIHLVLSYICTLKTPLVIPTYVHLSHN